MKILTIQHAGFFQLGVGAEVIERGFAGGVSGAGIVTEVEQGGDERGVGAMLGDKHEKSFAGSVFAEVKADAGVVHVRDEVRREQAVRLRGRRARWFPARAFA